MKRRRYVLLLVSVVVLCGIAVFYFLTRRPLESEKKRLPVAASTPAKLQTSPSVSIATPTPPIPFALPSDPVMQREIQDRKWDAVFSNSVNFYGKVVDEKGAPIEGASVRYSVPSNLLQIGKGTIEGPPTDANGLFSITGKTGAGITVVVAHPNYYNTDQSSRQVSYFGKIDPKPTASVPAVFVLRKKGTAEPLLKLKQVIRSVPIDGRPMQVGLTGSNSGDMTVAAWTSHPSQGAAKNAPFAWKVRVAVPRGGLIAYEDQYQFEAPESGYVPSVEFNMPAGGIDGKWKSDFEQTYFVKLGNGKYARMRFRMIAGGEHFAVVESYYNPFGSRNLEYDPQVIPEK